MSNITYLLLIFVFQLYLGTCARTVLLFYVCIIYLFVYVIDVYI